MIHKSISGSAMATSAYQAQRAQRVEILKKKLFEMLVEGDGGVFLAKTGAFIRGRSLRSHENRRVFEGILEAFPHDQGEFNDHVASRIWTKRLFKDTISALVSDNNLELPRIPGFSFDTWLEDQATLMQGLAKKARRNAGHTPRGSSSMSDFDATLPYNPEDRVAMWFGFSAVVLFGPVAH